MVHSVGGWAALTGAIILGARKGKYGKDGRVNPMPGSNIPLATLGTFILWMGWYGFNGGSVLALGDAAQRHRDVQCYGQHQHGRLRRHDRCHDHGPDPLQEG